MILQNLLGWLRRTLFGPRYEYIPLGDGQYLRVKRSAAAIVTADEIPLRIRQQSNSPRVRAARERLDSETELSSRSRRSMLKRLLPIEVAQRAHSDPSIRDEILSHPKLVDADSKLEADLKLAISAGEPVEPILDQQPDFTTDDLGKMLGRDWVAKWAHTNYGEKLPQKLTGIVSQTDSEHAKPSPRGTGRPSVYANNASKGSTSRYQPGTANSESNHKEGPSTTVGLERSRRTVRVPDSRSRTIGQKEESGRKGKTDTNNRSSTSEASTTRKTVIASEVSGSNGSSRSSAGQGGASQGSNSSGNGGSAGGGDVGGGEI